MIILLKRVKVVFAFFEVDCLILQQCERNKELFRENDKCFNINFHNNRKKGKKKKKINPFFNGSGTLNSEIPSWSLSIWWTVFSFGNLSFGLFWSFSRLDMFIWVSRATLHGTLVLLLSLCCQFVWVWRSVGSTSVCNDCLDEGGS